MNKFSLIIILCAIIVIGTTYLYIQLNEVNLQQIFNRETDSGSVFGDSIDETKDLPLSENQEQNGQSGSDISEGGESDEASQTTSQQTDSPCSVQQISYSIKKLQKSEICTQYEQEICIEKKANCSIEITNLDNNIAGEFEVTFNYQNEQKQTLALLSNTHTLAPQKSQLFETELILTDSQAQQTLSCEFELTKVPERQVCA